MKPFFRREPRRPINRSTARNSALINQLATPGLGSLMAGRFLAGTGQLLLAVAGFGMVVGWFVLLMIQVYKQLNGDDTPRSVAWLGKAGAFTFAAAWLWALVTSLQIVRSAKQAEQANVPPRL